MNVMDFIIRLFPGITSFGPWLSKKGVIYAVILGFALAFFLITIGFIPTPPADPEATAYPLWHVLYLVGFPVLFVSIQYFLTQAYLRSGQETKIGLAYDGHAVNIIDWKRTKNKLCSLLKNGKIKNRVTLRFVPLSYCTEGELADKFKKRYGFSILITVQQSPLLKNDSNNAQNPIPMIVTPIIATTEEAKQFLQITLKNALEIIKNRKTGPTLADVLDAQAHNLHDMMLLIVASLCFLQKKFEDSNAILRYLDNSISSIMEPNQSPRRQIRLLAMECCLRPAQFSIKNIPSLDRLMEIRNFAETALPFFDDSYFVPIGLARIRFLTGDIDGSIDLTREYGEKIEQIRASGQILTSRILPTYYLNLGFLSFIQGHWINACTAYSNMLAIDSYRNEKWQDLVEFIDYVNELDRFEGVCYLQMFYRLIAGQSIPAGLRKAAQDWVNQDDSRRELRNLLSRNYPLQPQKTNTIAQPKIQGKIVKQRSKRKGKPRRKRRRK